MRRIHWELEDVRLSDTHWPMRVNQMFRIALDITISIRVEEKRDAPTHCRHGTRKAGTRFQSVHPSNVMLSQSVTFVHIDKYSDRHSSNNFYRAFCLNARSPNMQLDFHLVQSCLYWGV
jgi:hypothetical protein